MQQFQGGNYTTLGCWGYEGCYFRYGCSWFKVHHLLQDRQLYKLQWNQHCLLHRQMLQTQAQFEGQNLSNRQQRAMLAAQQRAQFMGQEFDQAFQSRVQNSARIGDIANMNFTAEQQVQLENSRAVIQ
jgi:hypothetical protein